MVHEVLRESTKLPVDCDQLRIPMGVEPQVPMGSPALLNTHARSHLGVSPCPVCGSAQWIPRVTYRVCAPCGARDDR